jgi:multicomponent Na+:H+ antiporter subunit G
MEWVTGLLAVVGATLVLLAAIGVLRMPDLFTRMQAATKATTLGLGCLLACAAIQLADASSMVRALSIGAFLMLTSPVSTHVIARAAYLTHVPLWKGTIVNEWHLDEKSPREEPDDSSQREL